MFVLEQGAFASGHWPSHGWVWEIHWEAVGWFPLNCPSAVSGTTARGAVSGSEFEPRPFQRSRAPPCWLRGGWPPRPPHSVQHLSIMKTVSPSSPTWAPSEGGSGGERGARPGLARPLLSHRLRAGPTGLRSVLVVCAVTREGGHSDLCHQGPGWGGQVWAPQVQRTPP